MSAISKEPLGSHRLYSLGCYLGERWLQRPAQEGQQYAKEEGSRTDEKELFCLPTLLLFREGNTVN